MLNGIPGLEGPVRIIRRQFRCPRLMPDAAITTLDSLHSPGLTGGTLQA